MKTKREALIARLRQEPRGPLCDEAAAMLEADGKAQRYASVGKRNTPNAEITGGL